MLRVLTLASGGGSNLRALCAAQAHLGYTVVGVVTDREGIGALAFAASEGIPTCTVLPKAHPNRPAWDAALAETCASFSPDLVVLAGFMRIVGPTVVAAFRGRIVNVHPALLPSFPGVDGPAQALRAGVRVSGCTVHVVDEGLDSGPILAQATVPVLPGDTAAALHQRIQTAEHALLPAVVGAVARGDLSLGAAPVWNRWPAPSTGAAASTFYPPVTASPPGAPHPT